jgi:hypothetical protein
LFDTAPPKKFVYFGSWTQFESTAFVRPPNVSTAQASSNETLIGISQSPPEQGDGRWALERIPSAADPATNATRIQF